MFAAKQVIEGKIFIHHRRDKMLTVFHRHEVPAQYFECFINAQNFTGHFVEIHAQPADQVRVVYIKKNSTHQIIAMLNQSQYVLHLHPLTLILGKWSFRHRVLPNTLKIFAGLFALLFILFSATAFSADQFQLTTILRDCIQFTVFGLLLFLLCFVLPFVLPYAYFLHVRTLRLLKMLNINTEQVAQIEKLKSQSGIYLLQTQSDSDVKMTAPPY
ncbi:hypothetical protein NI470_01435 [Acinetobacter lwoffii]|uniref:hypothetical protein n=1 Tax=Acinetobacter lwoffii TaxID=28090 RepID=UPI00209AF729|nr:hypothetical protein [Acinetobacter lwoffii]MCO8072247.1 hypothetical protein [Acinetobacter lwoffii]MCO8075274.1 hypothetical protein [Acinetobacter lwoffii]